MTIQELADAAIKALSYESPVPLPGPAMVQLVMPAGKHESSRTRLVKGQKSPWGRVLCYNGVENGKHTMRVNFDALDVLAWAVANGAKVTAVLPDGRQIDLAELAEG